MNINELPFVMIKCLFLTILIELCVALILRVNDKRDILNIILVNVVTNPLVVSIPVLILVMYDYGTSIIVLVILEILTVIFEGLIYFKTLIYKRINPFVLSLILNLSSYLIGELINKL